MLGLGGCHRWVKKERKEKKDILTSAGVLVSIQYGWMLWSSGPAGARVDVVIIITGAGMVGIVNSGLQTTS